MTTLLVMNQPVGDSITLSRADGGQLQVFPQPAGSLAILPALVMTGNTPATPAVPFSPTNAGKLLAIADITPKVSGHLLVTITMKMTTGSPSSIDEPTLVLEYVPSLTSITGGVAYVGGVGSITLEPTSFTGGAPSAVMGSGETTGTGVEGGNQDASVILTAGVIAVVGQRTGIVINAFSPNNQAWTGVTLSVTVEETFQ